MNDFREMNEIDLSTQFLSTKENFTFRLHNVTYPEINWINIFHWINKYQSLNTCGCLLKCSEEDI